MRTFFPSTHSTINPKNHKDYKYDGGLLVVKKLKHLLLATSIVGFGLTSSALADNNGFSISVDGEVVAGDDTVEAQNRKTNVQLDDLDIQVKFDGLDAKPVLNVSTTDLRRSYSPGQSVEFIATSNYPDWIASSEVRIFQYDKFGTRKLVEQVPVGRNGVAFWKAPDLTADRKDEYEYVLRVYDDAARFDETKPLGLKVTESDFETHATTIQVVAAGEGEDRTAVRNIPVQGGSVTIYGRGVPEGYHVKAFGSEIPTDAEGDFVTQRILPSGDHNVDVVVVDDTGQAIEFDRSLNIPDSEWFYVGLADITLGKRFGDNVLNETSPGEYDKTYSKGRLAFYLKGKIKGQYLLTAAADTGDRELRHLFRGLDEKDPRSILRRIDPSKYYPVYGDDSKLYEDAPTQGKFYVRLEKDDSHVMWGNYKTRVKGTHFIRNERALYGAQAVLRSTETTSHGERVAEVEVYASQPDTLPQRDVFRGTGGSAYFLSRQDITRGSETVSIEARDLVTGRVISRKLLRDGQDYRIDYVQGVIILTSPLNSTTTDGELVRDGAIGGYALNLQVQYEFTPTLSDADGYSYGGRGQVWLGDHVRVGVSGIHEEAGDVDNRVVGVDAHVRLGDNSYVEGEIAKSEGIGFGNSYSNDGGLTIVGEGSNGINSRVARAFRAKAHIDLSDVDPSMQGAVGAYYEKLEEGFNTFSYNVAVDQRLWGAYANAKINDQWSYLLSYEDFEDDNGREKREGNAEVEYRFDETLALRIGVKHTHFDSGNATTSLQDGTRTDIGARLTFTPDAENKLYIFGQKTIKREGSIDRNDRYGIGFETQVAEKVGLRGEISNGTTGWGGLAAVTYDPTVDDHYYIGYELDPDRLLSGSSLIGRDLGGIVVGARRRHNEHVASYAENNYDLFGERRSLTTTYGVIYTPDPLWTIKGGLEYGSIEDPRATSFDRTALSLGIGYNDPEGVTWRLKGEARFEDSDDDTKDRTTWLGSSAISYKVNDDWRMVAAIDALISDSDQSSFRDGDYIQGSFGYAYRPVDNDRLNALVKYTYLYDLPGPDQITVNNGANGPAQRSHIFSADFIYQLSDNWTVGAKYGFRIGEVSQDRSTDDFTSSSAHLGILRADYHVIKNWDVFVEGRVLQTTELETIDFGAVAGAYRHVGENLKVGVGYNFGKFSDKLSDLTYDDGGVFLNIIGKF